MSDAINTLLSIAEELGVTCEFSQWSKAGVWWFEGPMPSVIRSAGGAHEGLRYFATEGTPHNRADEGFIDETAALAMAFERVS